MPRLLFALFFFTGFLNPSFVFAQKQDTSATPAASGAPAQTHTDDKTPHDTLRLSLFQSLKKQILTPVAPKPVSLRSVVVPSAMIAYGAITFASKGLQRLNLAIRDDVLEDLNRGAVKTLHLDDFSQYAPVVAVYALNLAGVKGKHRFVDRTALYGTSQLVGNLITLHVKRWTNKTRPDSSNNFSFPSGHTTTAFLAAEFLRQEYKDISPWYGVAAYTVAVGTGFLRLYNNKHWLNDVIAGAGIGLISTRLSYWLYPKLKNLVLHRLKTNTVLTPAYRNGTIGFVMVHGF